MVSYPLFSALSRVFEKCRHNFSQNLGASRSCYDTKTTPTSSTSLDLQHAGRVKLFQSHTHPHVPLEDLPLLSTHLTRCLPYFTCHRH